MVLFRNEKKFVYNYDDIFIINNKSKKILVDYFSYMKPSHTKCNMKKGKNIFSLKK